MWRGEQIENENRPKVCLRWNAEQRCDSSTFPLSEVVITNVCVYIWFVSSLLNAVLCSVSLATLAITACLLGNSGHMESSPIFIEVSESQFMS